MNFGCDTLSRDIYQIFIIIVLFIVDKLTITFFFTMFPKEDEEKKI